mgnify:CR=1 FL=1|jgi:hypothetical protein
MHEHGQAFVFIVTAGIFLLVLWLVRARRITERFAVLWVAISLGMLLASSVGYNHLFRISAYLGIPTPTSALFLMAIFGLTLLVIQLFTWASRLNERTRVLAQQVALLGDELKQINARMRELEQRMASGK